MNRLWFSTTALAMLCMVSAAGTILAAPTAVPAAAKSVPATAPASATSAPPDSLPLYIVAPMTVEAERDDSVTALPGARTVLGRAWLDRRDPITVSNALLPVPGLRIRGFGDGVSSFASVRGLGPERVAVLIDGRPVNTAQGGGVDLQPLDVEGLERVELLRGSMGAAYGPDAMAGAINLVRRNDRRSYLSLRAMAGTEERGLLRAAFGWSHERFDVEGSGRLETASPTLEDLQSQARTGGAWIRAAHRPEWAAALEAGLELRADRRDLPGSRAFPTPGAEMEDQFTEIYAALRDALAGPGAGTVEVSRSRQDRDYRDALAPLGEVDDSHRNDRTRAVASWRTAGHNGDLGLRVEGIRDELRSTTDGNVDRDRFAASAQATGRSGRWAVAPSVRWDAIQGFAPAASGRLTATREWDRGETGTFALRMGGGTTFRPPTFDDLFWPARASAAGNPNLEPERAWDLDLGVTLGSETVTAEASTFLTRVDDMIVWSPGADGVWRPRNVGQAQLSGLELGLGWHTETAALPLELNTSYTFTDARDATDDAVTGGNQLVGRAPHRIYSELLARPGAWTVGGGMEAVSRVPLTAANTKWQDGYVLAHALLRFRWSATVRMDLEVRNLLDTRYEDIRGYATTGRELLAGFRVTP